MKVRSLCRLTLAVSAIAIGVTGIAIAQASASPATVTLRFFSKTVSFKVTDAAGHPVSLSSGPPAVGDIFDSTDLDYVGDHKHHAKQWTVTDHLRCVLQSVPSTPTGPAIGVCDGQIAIGGSMLLADHVTAKLTASSTAVPITGGTGKYRGYHGTATSKTVGNSNNNDFTVVVHR